MSAMAAAALVACNTMTPEQERRTDLMWGAARECETGLGTLRVNRIDGDGTLHYTLWHGSQTDVPKFMECYRKKGAEYCITESSPAPRQSFQSSWRATRKLPGGTSSVTADCRATPIARRA